MSTQPPRRYTSLAIAIVVGALIIGAAVYASSFAMTTTVTVSPTTAIITSTGCICSAPAADCPCGPRGNITTSSLGGGGTTTTSTPTISASTTAASTSNSSDGLQFYLAIKSNGGANITVNVEELNLLDSVNNQTQLNQWKYPQESLDPFDNCDSNGPVGFAIFQGNYGMNNFSQAISLPLYNTTYLFSCTVNSTPFVYLFAPMSDQISVYLAHRSDYNGTATVSFSASGYWTGGEGLPYPATFNPFPAGVYTVLGADQWGNVLLLHFIVISSSSTGSTTNTASTETCTPAITETQGSNSSTQTTEVITLCHSLSYTTQSTNSVSAYNSSTS